MNFFLRFYQHVLNLMPAKQIAFQKQTEVFEEDMYRWYDRQINMESIFFYDITQLYYYLIVGQECQLIEVDEVISECVKKIKMVIDRYDDFWNECEEQKIDFEKRIRDYSI